MLLASSKKDQKRWFFYIKVIPRRHSDVIEGTLLVVQNGWLERVKKMDPVDRTDIMLKITIEKKTYQARKTLALERLR